MARLAWLELRYTKFQEAVKAYDNVMEATLKSYRSNNMMSNRGGGIDPPEQIIPQMAKEDLGRSIDLHLHPRFGLNALAPLPNEEGITDDRIRGEYRRTYDEFETSKNTLKDIDNLYKATINGLRSTILNFGKTLSNSP